MKKFLLSIAMTVMALTVNAQVSHNVYSGKPNDSKLMKSSMVQQSFKAVAPRQDLKTRSYVPLNKTLTLNPAKVKPIKRTQRMAKATQQTQFETFGKGQVQKHNMKNLMPTMTLNTKASAQKRAPRKAPAFAEQYTAVGANYRTKEVEQWTMTPGQATFVDQESGDESTADVLVDVIPTPDYLSEIYPDGIPVKYTVSESNVITIQPQAVAHYVDTENNNRMVFLTIFSANSDDEDGIINMTVDENGKLTVTNGNMICLGEFANVEFDPEMMDGDAFLYWDELYLQVTYYYNISTTIDKEYKAHAVDYFANQPEDWIMQRGTTAMDDERYHFFVNMTPLTEMFAEVFPEGIEVEYEQEGSTITVKPQVIASLTGDEGEDDEYVILCSGTAEDGCIVLTEGEGGSLTTIKNESVIIGAWSTDKFDASFDTYLGAYLYMDNVKYILPDATPEAPEDVACEPNELVLFAGMGISGYHYSNNLGITGAYAPLTFRNNTFDIATNFEWSATEIDEEEVAITGTDREFGFDTKGNYVYTDFSLTGYNETAKSEPFKWGIGHAFDAEDAAAYIYAGSGQSSFEFTDGSYATMTRQNPDYDPTFYINWATPDIQEQYNASLVAKIYSYQGKPSTPLFMTGVTLPLVSFEAKDNFSLHISLHKCLRTSTGNLTLGDVIAEGDATIDNVISDYAGTSGLTAINFDELYVVDEAGLSETVDYLFIEDEFVIVIDDWGNGTFSGVLGSQEYNFNEVTSTWFERPGEEGRMRSYGGGWPMLFIGLNDATYGYLYTEDNTNLQFDAAGGEKSIHVDPMYYSIDEETEQPTYSLMVEKIIVDGEEVEEVPEWLEVKIANEDYTTATAYDDEGDPYEYFVNGIDYDLVFQVEPLGQDETERNAEISFMQTGARLTVTLTQGGSQGVSAVITKTPLNNSRVFNLAGQNVKNVKGIVVKDGRKILVK